MQIHELPEAASVADTDQIAIDTGTNTKKFTILGLLRKIIGTTSISGIGDGTVTGAISALNSGKSRIAYQDIAITLPSNGVIQINQATGYTVSYTNFLRAIVISTNNVSVTIYTYSNLIYAFLHQYNSLTAAAAGSYTIRVFYIA